MIRRVQAGKAGASVPTSTGSARTEIYVAEEQGLKNHSKKKSGLERVFMTLSVRSYFDKLSTNGNIRCRRARIEKRSEERVRFEKSIYDLERPFMLRQAQHERG
jgi:cell division protein FtsL